MIRTTLTWLLLSTLLSNEAAAQSAPRVPQGEPPTFCKVMMLGEKVIKLNGPGGAAHKCELADLDFVEPSGKKLSLKEVRERVKVGSVVVVGSDEKKIDPAYLAALKPDTVVVGGVTVVLARADKPGRGWTMDQKLMTFGNGSVDGRMLGASFKPTEIKLLNTGLSLSSGNDRIHIFLGLKPGLGIAGKSFEWKAEDKQDSQRPSIHVHMHSTKPISAQAFQKDYCMRLEFGNEKDGKIEGKIYLCLPDDKKSWIAGNFTLDLR